MLYIYESALDLFRGTIPGIPEMPEVNSSAEIDLSSCFSPLWEGGELIGPPLLGLSYDWLSLFL